jgi:hypothetical protein
LLREIDLAGNPLRETSLAALNAQLSALGHEPIHAFHHDAQRLADGTTPALGLTERTITSMASPPQLRAGRLVTPPDQRSVAS